MPAGTASAGTMVAAVLESAGYYYQSHILDQMGGAFTGSLGGFIYLIGVAVTIFAVAIRGGYRFGAWLLIGPPLFFSMVVPRSPVDHVSWKFAQEARNDEKVQKELGKMGSGLSGPANVSTLFARYTELIANTMQEMVKIINGQKTETDKWFIIRAQLMSRLYGTNAEHPYLQTLINHSLNRTCGDYVAAARIINDARQTAAERRRAEDAMKLYETQRHLLLEDAVQQVIFVRQQGDIRSGGGTLSTNPEEVRRETFTCKDIWLYVYLSLEIEGMRVALNVRDQFSMNGINVAKGLQSIGKAMGLVPGDAPDIGAADDARILQDLALVAGKFILRNESNRQSFAGRIQDTAFMSREYDTVEAPAENQLAQTELARARSTEWAEKTRLMTAASNLPYYQGLLLYFLSIAFPFFALLLLVPGKHGGFIMWFVLWLWVKSWDVAMALVMQLDNVLFSLMNLSKELRTAPVATEKLTDDFNTAILSMVVSDPTFNMTTYYNIIGAALAAIPIITSQIILGSMSGGASVIAAGMKNIGEDLSEGAGKTQSQAAVSNSRHQHQELAMSRMSTYFRNRAGRSMMQIDPQTNRPFYEKFAARPLGADPNHPGKFAAEAFQQHVTFGPSAKPGFTASNRYADNAAFSLSEKTDKAKTFRAIQGAASALGRGDSGSALKFFMPSSDDKKGWAPEIMQATFGGIDGAAGAYANFLSSTLEAEINPIAKWALLDSNFSERGKQLAAQARIYNQLEVPWSISGDVGEIAESDLEMAFITAETELKASWIKSFSGFTSKAVKAGLGD